MNTRVRRRRVENYRETRGHDRLRPAGAPRCRAAATPRLGFMLRGPAGPGGELERNSWARQPSSRLIPHPPAPGCRLVVPWFHDYVGPAPPGGKLQRNSWSDRLRIRAPRCRAAATPRLGFMLRGPAGPGGELERNSWARQPSSRLIPHPPAPGCRLVVPWFHDYVGPAPPGGKLIDDDGWRS